MKRFNIFLVCLFIAIAYALATLVIVNGDRNMCKAFNITKTNDYDLVYSAIVLHKKLAENKDYINGVIENTKKICGTDDVSYEVKDYFGDFKLVCVKAKHKKDNCLGDSK
jgi:hypothetical protein